MALSHQGIRIKFDSETSFELLAIQGIPLHSWLGEVCLHMKHMR